MTEFNIDDYDLDNEISTQIVDENGCQMVDEYEKLFPEPVDANVSRDELTTHEAPDKRQNKDKQHADPSEE